MQQKNGGFEQHNGDSNEWRPQWRKSERSKGSIRAKQSRRLWKYTQLRQWLEVCFVFLFGMYDFHCKV